MKFKRVFLKNKKTIMYQKLEVKSLKIKILISSLLSKNIIFYFLNKFLSNILSLKVNSIKNFCVESGRSRGLQKTFWLSRIKLREFVNNRLLTGIKKASW